MDYNTVQRVEIKDYKRAAATLAAAFIEDPVTLYFCRHPHTLSKRQVQQRNEYISYPIQGMLIVQGYDGVYHLCAYPRRRGLSDWGLWRCRTMVRAQRLSCKVNSRMPPWQNMDDYLTIFKSGMWRLYYKLSNEGRKRFFNEFFPLLHDTKYSLPSVLPPASSTLVRTCR